MGESPLSSDSLSCIAVLTNTCCAQVTRSLALVRKRQLEFLAAVLRFGFTSAADVVADTPLALLLVLLVLMLTSLCGPGWCEVVWTIILAAVVVIAFPALIGRPIGTLP